MELTSDERLDLEEALASLGRQWGRKVSFGELVRGWRQLVEKIERGYDDSVYEYENDLEVRAGLERVMVSLPSHLRRKLEPSVALVDRQFMDATGPAASPLRRGDNLPMWWTRVPLQMSEELRTDLRESGHLP